jgi:hypothetical protein
MPDVARCLASQDLSSLSYDALNETQGCCRPHLETGSGVYLKGRDLRKFFPMQGLLCQTLVDLPDRQPGEKGWGQKVVAIWRWKNELPAIYPEVIFYGKIPAGRAALMSMDYLRVEHYPKHHRPLMECSALAQSTGSKI